jgi:UDP-N-acetyl-D-mannosaminuronic acid dehydrogenase
MPFNTISVVGLGYIGLPTAAVIASRKIKVVGVDISQLVIDTINKGKIHIVEPELDMIVNAAVTEGYLRATTTPEPADAFLIAVPTPFKGDHEPDLTYIESASRAIAAVLKKGDLIVLESTSPVGTTEQMAAWLADERPDLSFPQTEGEESDIRIAHCPERVLPGHVIRELIENDRVIGGMTPRCSEVAANLYKIFVEAECVITNARTAEMAKLTENSFRDVNVAFANELSIICEKLDINVWELIKLANRHPRVNVLRPGPGVGGHCIAVDPWFIVSKTPEEARLIRAAREVNNSKPDRVIEKVEFAIAEFLEKNPEKNVKDVKVGVFGLSFKPDIDDLRESPALAITEKIVEIFSGQICIVEPHIDKLPKQLESRAKLTTIESCVESSNVLVMLVGHKSFREFRLKVNQECYIVDAIGLME